jgi:predicted Zn-dependent protease
MPARIALAAVLAGLWVPWAFAQDPPPFYSAEKEAALGRSLAAELEKESRVLEDPVVAAFVREMAHRLAQNAETDTALTVTILDSPDARTHSLPGGYLLVRSGVVARTEAASELAGILAHEIAHIVSRHGIRQTNRGQAANLSSIPIIFLGGWMGACSRMSAGSEAPVVWRRLGEQQEHEADLLGLTYLDRAGYEPSGLVDAFDKLEAAGLITGARPSPAVRERAAENASSGQTYLATSSEFVAVRERLPQPPRQGRVESVPSLRRTPEP